MLVAALLAAAAPPLAAGCGPAGADTAGTADAARTLVVINDESEESRLVGAYYAQRRGIPYANVVRVRVAPGDEVDATDFYDDLLVPVRNAIRTSLTPIDFIVLTKGVPLRIGGRRGYSVDGQLVQLDSIHAPPVEPPTMTDALPTPNPYFAASTPFTSARYGMYLVTRLDCYEVTHCRALVDRSLAALPERGLFFINPSLDARPGYIELQRNLLDAHVLLETRGFTSRLASPGMFEAPVEQLEGYASWGSNDARFDRDAWLRLRFRAGAIAETYVSTSARTFSRSLAGQSLVADLVESGVTGVKGYVSEPYGYALARVPILFDRYTRGFTLAESFYAASPVIRWKDVVIGDPLCRPFAPAPRADAVRDTSPAADSAATPGRP
ncbi:MAG: TIGR03790 family protein [Gemmatimonadetes bacterium]|nr:TIGR03790 family protein [Gemmatimonadota bacterium]